MSFLLEHNYEFESLKKNKLMLFGLLFFLIFLTFFFIVTGFSPMIILGICIFPFLAIAVFNFELSLVLLVVSLFINIHISYFTLSEILAPVVILSFLVTHKFETAELKNSLLPFFSIFVVSLLPSFINAQNIPITILLSFRIIFFGGLFIFIPLAISDYNKIKSVLKIFLFMVIANALHTIYIALTAGGRAFGFAGIMFVDYAGVSIVMLAVFLFFQKEKRLILAIALVILIIAFIFTQTRNTWLSCGATFILMLIKNLKSSARFGLNRKKILALMFALTFAVIISFIAVKSLSGVSFNRLTTAGVDMKSTESSQEISEIGSLASRFFIWFTAWNAFNAHPLVGIGIYNFPFVSQQYSTIDPYFYETFVEGLSPHITYLAILTENGIIGLIGFLIFLFFSLRDSGRIMNRAKSKEEMLFSSLFFWSLVYTSFSMMMSDAWLWGHGLMLWGILLSFFIANSKVVAANKKILFPTNL